MTRDIKIAACLYLVCVGIYAGTAAGRLRAPSGDTHFIWMADGWLHRRLDLARSPPHTNDWAEVEYLTLHDGKKVAGAFQRLNTGRFRSLDGKVRSIADSEIKSRERKYYVSFPPMPAVLMLPLVWLFGFRTNDVIFNVVIAGLAPALCFLVLRRMRTWLAEEFGLHPSPDDPMGKGPKKDPNVSTDPRTGLSTDLWLTGMFAVGSVLYFSSVLGQVWYTAHLVSQVLAGLFLLCAFSARRPMLAGLCLGALMLTRPQMVFFGLFLFFEALRMASSERRFSFPRLSTLRPALRPLVLAAIPFTLLCSAGFAYNYARFHSLLEFGHSYLTTMQADNIQRYGLFNYEYLSRNLSAAFTLLPKFLGTAPYLQISYHGLSLFLTTPVLAYLLWPETTASPELTGARRVLWICVLPIAIFSFLYQNDGYIQFGFRFSLDYMLLLVLLLCLGSPRAIHTRLFRALVLVGVGVNLFGAISFGRMWQFYFNGFFPVGP